MTMQAETFAAGAAPRVIITECQGALTIQFWDERNFALEPAADSAAASQSDSALVIHAAHGDMRLRVPAATAIVIEDHRGDVRVETVDGSVRLRDIDGNVFVSGAAALTIERDELLRDRTWRFRRSHRDVEARAIGSADIAEVHGSLTLTTAHSAVIGEIGGSAAIQAIAGDLRVGAVGGSCDIGEVGGALELGSVGGSYRIAAVAGSVRAGAVGGSAEVRATGAIQALGSIGGSARIELPAQANLRINAIVGGRISAPGTSGGPGMRTIVYGDGAARLSITVGGSLTLV